jgi:lipoprotein-anchoring transpeptidase ErfK/SrfK
MTTSESDIAENTETEVIEAEAIDTEAIDTEADGSLAEPARSLVAVVETATEAKAAEDALVAEPTGDEQQSPETLEDKPSSGSKEAGRSKRLRIASSLGAWMLSAVAAVLTVTLALSGTAYAFDRTRAERILPGYSIGGVAVGGLDATQAKEVLREHVRRTGERRLHISAAGKTLWFSLSQLDLAADVDRAVEAALASSRREPIVERVRRWFASDAGSVEIPLEFSISREALDKRVVASVAGAVNREPTEATIEETTDDIVFRPATPGIELETAAASDIVYDAALQLANGRDPGLVRLPTKEIPAAEGAGVTTAILVRIREQKLYFYQDAKLVRTYTVSTGTPSYPTPLGRFKVVQKIVNPSWTNPAPNGWGKDMPAYIPPGPDNPLGTRALQLNAPGILIHGTQHIRALGSPASHGCIRMRMSEIEELFPKIPVGTPVFIRP